MGVLNSAYYDNEVANYHVSTGSYTAWNNGWVYRNDGVDLEKTTDNVNTNGYSLGWLGTDEWIQYSVNVAASAVYEVEVRVASIGTEGKFHFQSGLADISEPAAVPNTGDWENWETVKVSGLVLTPEDEKIRFYVDKEGFNVGSFKFAQTGLTTDLATQYLSAFTLEDQRIGEIQVFDLLGQKVLEREISSPGSFRENLHLEHLSSGSYLVVVRREDGQILSRKQVIVGEQ